VHRRLPTLPGPDIAVPGVVAARRFFVSGKVQGVFYRASTVRVAEQFKLRGFTRNLPDGRVEVLAVGDVASLAALLNWLQQGPPLSKVTEVTEQAEDPTQYPDIRDFRTA